MNPFIPWSRLFGDPVTKIILYGLGIFVTASLGPISILATYALLRSFTVGGENTSYVHADLLGLGCLLGILGFWVRLIVPAKSFRSSLALRIAASGLLIAGTFTAAALTYFLSKLSNQSDIIYPVAFCVLGVFLLGATLGEPGVAP